MAAIVFEMFSWLSSAIHLTNISKLKRPLNFFSFFKADQPLKIWKYFAYLSSKTRFIVWQHRTLILSLYLYFMGQLWTWVKMYPKKVR